MDWRRQHPVLKPALARALARLRLGLEKGVVPSWSTQTADPGQGFDVIRRLDQFGRPSDHAWWAAAAREPRRPTQSAAR